VDPYLLLVPVAAAGFGLSARLTRERAARRLLYGAAIVVPLMLLVIGLGGF
jgi:hypothetical protein